MARLMNKTGVSLQQKAEVWTEDVSATRRQEPRRQSHLLQRLVPVWVLSQTYRGGGGRRAMRALVSHQPSSSNATLLPFTKGEIISVLVQQPRNGWLYGRAESSARLVSQLENCLCARMVPSFLCGSLDDPPKSTMSSNSSVRSSSSLSSQLSQSGSSTHSPAPPSQAPPPPPPAPSLSSMSQMSKDLPPVSQPASNSQPKSSSEKKGAEQPRPELFPRGTNPFATVKLKPTKTNDRSAPKLRR
ncbi:hypothetical protein WMY93_002773 [Mugilogobius chulae]|uniref:SH3 domain-containing protein n=1 Tax=Mugilogobius chulae TaxID=88201 RepID=A0AAW0Q5F4_9GOBI